MATSAAASKLGSIGLSVWQYGRNAALGAAEYMTPVLTDSAFADKGVLTPEEFVAAGDMLVLRCPTWVWQAGDPAQARPYLPADKQFLITRSVPCQRRAAVLGAGADDDLEVQVDCGDGEEEWTATHANHTVRADDEAPDMVAAAAAGVANLGLGGGASASASASAAAEAALEEEDLEDLGAVMVDDLSAGPDNLVRARSYDVSITYDKYYQCARVWLYGYSESRQPLTQAELLEDISADHALKTVTLEAHPHIATGAGLHASIHPCKHAAVMHKLCAELRSAGKECRVEQYLFLFLKFISSVIPTVEYDYTLSVEGL